MTTPRRSGFWPWFVEGLSILLLVWLLFAVVSGLGRTFFTLQPSTEVSSVAALSHDGSSQHHMSLYLCVDAGNDTVDGTVVIDLSSKDINLHLPGIPNLTTSLGFLSKASAFASPPGCLDNPKIRRISLVLRTRTYCQRYALASKRVSLLWLADRPLSTRRP